MNRTPIKWLLLKKKRNVYPGSLRQNQMFRPSETTEVSMEETHHHILQFETHHHVLQFVNLEIEYRLDMLCATNGAHLEVYWIK